MLQADEITFPEELEVEAGVARNFSNWVDFVGHDGTSILDDKGEVMLKDDWKNHTGLNSGGCWRLAVVPINAEMAAVYLVALPMALDQWMNEVSEPAFDQIDHNFSGESTWKVGEQPAKC